MIVELTTIFVLLGLQADDSSRAETASIFHPKRLNEFKSYENMQ